MCGLVCRQQPKGALNNECGCWAKPFVMVLQLKSFENEWSAMGDWNAQWAARREQELKQVTEDQLKVRRGMRGVPSSESKPHLMSCIAPCALWCYCCD